jgi:hypothetical protein
VPAITSAHPPSSTEATRPPANSPAGVPTRLAGGPVVLRVVGATHRPRLRYVLIFRLNRPYPRWPKDAEDPDGPAPLPQAQPTRWAPTRSPGSSSTPCARSSTSIRSAGRTRTTASSAGSMVVHRRFPTFCPGSTRSPPAGACVVRLRPLTPDRRGRPAHGPSYVRHPQLIPTRVRPYDHAVTGYRDRATPGLYLEVISRDALRALRRTGCSATVLHRPRTRVLRRAPADREQSLRCVAR